MVLGSLPYSDLIDISNLILGIGTVSCAVFVLIVILIGLAKRKWGKTQPQGTTGTGNLAGILRNLGITLPDGGKSIDDDEDVPPPGFE
jgi:hypothetical protein